MKALRKMMMAFVAIAALGLTTACEKDNSEPASGNTDGNIVGTWKVDKMTLNGMSMNTDSLNIAILVNSDGTGVVSRPDATLSFAWSQNGTTLTITPTAFGSSFDYTITLLTDTEANIIGTVVPGTDMQGDVSVHMVRIANPGDDPDPNPGDDPGDDPNPGDDPGDDPNPGDDPGDDPNPGETGEFPAGTAWTYSYSNTVTQDNMTITVNLNMDLTFNATGNTGSMHMVVSAITMGIPMGGTEENINFTYTYDATTHTGVATGSLPGTSTETLPFTYNPDDDTIVIEVPADATQDQDLPIELPSSLVFTRVNN